MKLWCCQGEMGRCLPADVYSIAVNSSPPSVQCCKGNSGREFRVNSLGQAMRACSAPGSKPHLLNHALSELHLAIS